MTASIRLFRVALALALSGCSGMELSRLDGQLHVLHSEKVELVRANRETVSVDGALAALATQATAAAAQATDQQNRVAFYRVAAVAAWQAGDAGASSVLAISDAGAAACDRLPQGDRAAPRDCSLIRLAAPLAVQDDLARALIGFQRELAASGRPQLPASDHTPVQGLFDGFETQFDKVSTIRGGLADLDVPAAFTSKTDRQRVIMYCNAVKAWSLSADVEGATLGSFTAMADRKKQMANRLAASGQPTDCTAAQASQSDMMQ